MEKIGFVVLGIMGKPMAVRIVNQMIGAPRSCSAEPLLKRSTIRADTICRSPHSTIAQLGDDLQSHQ